MPAIACAARSAARRTHRAPRAWKGASCSECAAASNLFCIFRVSASIAQGVRARKLRKSTCISALSAIAGPKRSRHCQRDGTS
jgi:hypothetical protein